MRRFALPLALVSGVVAALAAASVRPSLTVYFAPGFEDKAWQTAAYEKVAKGWKAAGAPKAGAKCVLIAVVGRDGKLAGLRDHMASGDAAWDGAAAEAVKGAAPFAPLPKDWPHPTLEAHWHFENTK